MSNDKCAFDNDFKSHLEEFAKLARHTETIYETVSGLQADIKHLETLPLVVQELRLLRESLIGPATNRNFMPLAAVVPMILSMALCMSVLGGLLLTHMGGEKMLDITPHSIQVR